MFVIVASTAISSAARVHAGPVGCNICKQQQTQFSKKLNQVF